MFFSSQYAVRLFQVVNCLKKALRVASQCMDPVVQVQLYITVFSHYLYFYEAGCDEVGLL